MASHERAQGPIHCFIAAFREKVALFGSKQTEEASIPGP